jgi:hypothetical protein
MPYGKSNATETRKINAMQLENISFFTNPVFCFSNYRDMAVFQANQNTNASTTKTTRKEDCDKPKKILKRHRHYECLVVLVTKKHFKLFNDDFNFNFDTDLISQMEAIYMM